jgi:galacturonosyltransferase
MSLITGLGSGLDGNGISSKIINKLYRIALAKSGYIFFQNEGDVAYFRKTLEKKDLKYVLTKGSGVNLDEYNANLFICGENVKGGQDDNEIDFLFIARIQKEKGIEEYLEAARYFAEKNRCCVFNILGAFEDEKYRGIINKLSNDGIVRYLGVSEDTRYEMSKADCIVLPSYHEGMSNVILEGAAMGLPVITCDVHGCLEAVDDELTGFLSQPRDAESLIGAIERYVDLSIAERLRMGLRGREKMIREFDRKTVVKQYMEAVHESMEYSASSGESD